METSEIETIVMDLTVNNLEGRNDLKAFIFGRGLSLIAFSSSTARPEKKKSVSHC